MEESNSSVHTETYPATAILTIAKARTKLGNRYMYVISCVFCKESLTPVNCTIVKRHCVCFNCLGHHNVSD